MAASKLDRSKVVVVLEQDDNLRGMLARVLQEGGYYTVPVKTGSRALAVLRQVHARLLLVDGTLSDMPSSRVIELLQADEWTKDIQVVVLSPQLLAVNREVLGVTPEADKKNRWNQLIGLVENSIGKPSIDGLSFRVA